MVRFEYVEPKTLQEATSFLSANAGKALVLAGGTDLLLALKLRQKRPQYVVNIKRLPNLDYITYSDREGLKFGALTTCRSLERSPVVREKYIMLAETAGIVGSEQVRTTATVVGNLCNALPSAEMAPPLLTLEARVKIGGPQGRERVVPLGEFFTGPRENCLQPGELVVEVQVPPLPPRTGMIYLRHSPRRAMDLAVVGVASVVMMDETLHVMQDVRIGLGAVSPTPMRARRAEEILRGQRVSQELLERAAMSAAEECKPISDIRSSAEYRREMVRVLTRRMTKVAIERAGQEPSQRKFYKYHLAIDFANY